jgi:hypothetical protein
MKMTSKAKKKLAPRKELASEEKTLAPRKELPGKKVAGAQESAERSPSQASSPAGAGSSEGAGLTLPKAKPSSASPAADRPGPPSKAKEFRSMKPDRSQAAACRGCGWAGVIGDCTERGMGGDAYSEGWAWHCPHCKAVVEVYAWRQLALIVISS